MKRLLLMAGIALLCLGQSEDDHLNAQSLTPKTKAPDTLRWMVNDL
jgi:hypothetical protein